LIACIIGEIFKPYFVNKDWRKEVRAMNVLRAQNGEKKKQLVKKSLNDIEKRGIRWSVMLP
jgi:hypothetical protein